MFLRKVEGPTKSFLGLDGREDCLSRLGIEKLPLVRMK